MVNLVIVSHSARLGEGVGELARQMLMNDGCKLAIAAGIDDPDSPIGTDPLKVMEAIESVADTDHVLVMMDIGSAVRLEAWISCSRSSSQPPISASA